MDTLLGMDIKIDIQLGMNDMIITGLHLNYICDNNFVVEFQMVLTSYIELTR